MHRILTARVTLTVLVALIAFCLGSNAAEKQLELAYTWSVEASYPDFESEPVDKVVREWLEKHIEALMDDAKGMASADPDFPEGSLSLVVSAESINASDKYGSVLFHTFISPSGAAHPMSYIEILNLDFETGRVLTFDDLFENPDKAIAIIGERAPALIKEYLEETYAHGFPGGIDDDVFFSDGMKPTRENFEAVSLQPDGIQVHFQLYQVVPYAFGMPVITLPLDQLRPAGPNPDIWPTKTN
jgi:Protein of unknown function (DUF3298).